jgi:7,8-dihydro-6-hydroxymethylpterin-pyrophosphokinase
VRTADKFAPRTIDLDIALFNYEVMDIDGRHIPDPDIQNHAYVVVPLADLAPYYVHPETGKSLKEMASTVSSADISLQDKFLLNHAVINRINKDEVT